MLIDEINWIINSEKFSRSYDDLYLTSLLRDTEFSSSGGGDGGGGGSL